jgi:hypothetical protein
MNAPIIKKGMTHILSPEQCEKYYNLDNPQFSITEQFESNNFKSGTKYTNHYLWHQETNHEGIAIKWEGDFFEDENSYKDDDGEFVIYYRVIRK